MISKRYTTMTALVCAVALSVAGCETAGESGLGGAALGAGAGAIIGNQSGHAGEGAIIGALAGGLAGLIVHDAKSRQQRNAQQTAEVYEYAPTQGEKLVLEDSGVVPSAVRRGNMVEGSIQYAILGTGSGMQVTETRSLRQGDRVISDLSSQRYTRTDGTWVTSQQFRVSERLAPGEYTLVQTVTTGNSRIMSTTPFYVD